MVRHPVQARTSFAAARVAVAEEPAGMPRSAARLSVSMVRLIVAPFALAAAALAGLVFAALLPICGIATICEGFAKTSWRFVRDTFSREPHLPARRI